MTSIATPICCTEMTEKTSNLLRTLHKNTYFNRDAKTLPPSIYGLAHYINLYIPAVYNYMLSKPNENNLIHV